MSKNNSQSQPIDAFPIPEGAIVLESINTLSLQGLTIAALQQVLKERNLDLPLGPELDLQNPDRLINLNQFAIQIVVCGFIADEITIPLNHWYQIGAAPQLILAAQVDEENNVVFFRGVLTGQEFEALISQRLDNQEEINLSVDRFHGGIDRLLRFVRLLQPSAISRAGIKAQVDSDWQWDIIKKRLKATISVAVVATGTILLGPQFLKPRLSGSLALLTPSQLNVQESTRNINKNAKVCLLTPEFKNFESSPLPIAFVSVDRPLIFLINPLKELKISKNGIVVFRKLAPLNKKIEGPIPWPLKDSIQPNEIFEISFRPTGSPPGSWAKSQVKLDPKNSIQDLDLLIDSLGKNQSEWIKRINRELKKDKGLALTLLFSKRSPQTEILNSARIKLIEKDSCLQDK